MSARGKRQTPSRQTPTPTASNVGPSVLPGPVEEPATPQAGGATNNAHNASPTSAAGSPLTPGQKISRAQEQEKIRSLNDRLATYIQIVQNLENENKIIKREITTLQTTRERETSTVRTMFESELTDARQLLDETAREKAKLEIDIKRLWEELEEVKLKLDKKTKECTAAEANARVFETRYNDANANYNITLSERDKLKADFKDLVKDNERIRKQLDESRKNLEAETLARVELENTIQSLREEIAFKEQLHVQEMQETRTSMRQIETTEIDGQLSDRYEARLQESLAELREQYEDQLAANREEIEHMYEAKIRGLEGAASCQANIQMDRLHEIQESRKRIDELYQSVSKLEADNVELTKRLREAERALDQNRVKYATHIGDLERECQALRDEIAKQLAAYHDLKNGSVTLNAELSTYECLLNQEENRLNITPRRDVTSPRSSASRQTRKTPLAGSNMEEGPLRKRKRERMEETQITTENAFRQQTSCDVEIIDSDKYGKFVKLKNKGKTTVALGNWIVTREADDGEGQLRYTLPSSVKLEPGQISTIWSAGATSITMKSPTHFMLKKNTSWPTGTGFRTELLSPVGEVKAWHESCERNSRYYLDHAQADFSNAGAEDVFHQGGISKKAGSDKCFLM